MEETSRSPAREVKIAVYRQYWSWSDFFFFFGFMGICGNGDWESSAVDQP